MSNGIEISHKNCYDPYGEFNTLWCKECVPRHIIEGWTSENHDIDEFIKDTIYNAKYDKNVDNHPLFLEWVPFDRFENIKQIGEGGFSKVYSATWIDGKAKYIKQDDGTWKKGEPKPMTIALKKLNDSQNISAEYLKETKTLWNIYFNDDESYLNFYGITKDPETKEFIMIVQLANQGSLRQILSNNFNNLLWKDKLRILVDVTYDLKRLHKLSYFHKDFHSGNILQNYSEDDDVNFTYISDFGLSGPANERQSDDKKTCGVLPYIAPEVLNGESCTLSSDIYSFGVIMTELSSGKPPFYEKQHDISLVLEIFNGIRPEFGKGTPEIYKKLAYKCMNANPNQRPTAEELEGLLLFWYYSLDDSKYYQESGKFGNKGKEVKALFEEADKEIPNISTSYEKNPDAIYTSRIFTFSNLPNPINSSIITSYFNEEGDNNGIIL
ncbi:Cmk1p [Rhizophagus irregularis DAOM 197198w]|uniref:Cmk1p n=1 Tax=Rhizophagus irregularis (strain DAOM 197198w) TaxID=1432141 RepID=A0A015JBJ1_RHIIW|nr:Cmk1p [Rhizophagus irregularis DAOM 197198w]